MNTTSEKKPKRKLNLSPEERERRREAGRKRFNEHYAALNAERQKDKELSERSGEAI